MAINQNSDSIISRWYTDESGNKISIARTNDYIQIIGNKIPLPEIPDPLIKINTISIDDTTLYEIPKGSTISVDTFIVDYETGYITLGSSSHDGKTALLPSWSGRGLILQPASRIYLDNEDEILLDKLVELDDRIATIITTPAGGVSEQEIIDARDGEAILGDTIRDIKSNISNISQEITDISQEIINARDGQTTLENKISSIDSTTDNLQTQITNLSTNKADNSVVASLQTQVNSLTDGSPKGVYATVSALTTAFPTGTDGVYVVTADGHWYYWNGSAWADGGVYQATEIAEQSITPQKTNFFELTSKNLFNKLDITTGYYVSYTTGALQPLASYGVSDFIPVLPNTVYTKSHTQQMPFYDINKTFISGVDGVRTFTTPSNCYYVRINFELVNIDAIQLELGNSRTSYEPFNLTLQSNAIMNNNKIVKLTHGKNLFDKSKAYSGYYIYHATGQVNAVANYYASDYIEVEEGQTYTKTYIDQFAYYNANKQYVSGVIDGTSTFTIPVGVKYARFTIASNLINVFQIEKGSVQTSFEDYKLIVPSQYISTSELNKEGRIKTVAKSNGQYGTINAAISDIVAQSLDYDTTIQIYPGEYEEFIDDLRGDKKIALIGINKRDCILIDKSGDYYKSPLQISGRNFIKNLSIIANNDNVETLSFPYAYGAHLDYSGAGETVFEDCYFESLQNAAVGIGMHQNQTLIFKNCDFYKNSIYDGGCFYFHNSVSSGVTNQKLILINCRIIAEQGYALKMDDANIGSGDGLGNDMEVTFINCMFYSKTLGLNCVAKNTNPIGVGTIVGNIKLSPMSYGNNITSLNA